MKENEPKQQPSNQENRDEQRDENITDDQLKELLNLPEDYKIVGIGFNMWDIYPSQTNEDLDEE